MTEPNHNNELQALPPHSLRVDVAVVGGGPAGLTAAIALAAAGIRTALVSKPAVRPDNRTTALLGGSVAALKALGVWQSCENDAARIEAIRIVDDTARLIRAPEVIFQAAEIGADGFGYNIENRHLIAALEGRAASFPHLVRIDGVARQIEFGENEARIDLEPQQAVGARLIIGADGRQSVCRGAAAIGTNVFDYGQTALTLNLRHTRPHKHTSTEFHTESGPFTLVPLPGMRSSVVWVVKSRDAERLTSLPRTELEARIERQSHSILGKISLEHEPCMFPLRAEIARTVSAPRLALIGEAAHLLPPIGAQGLNLGLRDAATIAQLAASAIRAGGDPGGQGVTAAYETARRTDVTSRTIAVDLLNRSLLSDFLPIQGIRGLGLYLVDRIGPLRRGLMREGIAPTFAAPKLMRGEPL